jgi:MYXO-CTERM domain-containing protein
MKSPAPARFPRCWPTIAVILVVILVGGLARPAAADLTWKGHTWQVTSGGMAGVCQGDPNNVTVDSNGYLHFKISNTGGTWTASEMFTTDKLGFGTYQWQVDGPVDSYDKNIVLGLFPYGPAANIGVDGTNEIDIEYSRWGQANGPNADWTDYPNSGTTQGELSFNFTLSSTLSTSRFIWTDASIQDFLIDGLQPVNSTTGLIKTWTYAPQNASTNVPQSAMPLGMNLWCFSAPPSNGQPMEIVIRDFQFVPEGASTGGSGGGGAGTAGAGGVGGSTGAAGGGSTGAGGVTTATGSAGGGGHASGQTSPGGCSCAVADDAGARGGAPSLLLLLALVFRRRRRR